MSARQPSSRPTTSAAASAPTTQAPTVNDWLVYHHDIGGTGVAPSVNLAPAHQAWTSPTLDGTLFGEPLIVGGSVLVATENDTVYELDAATGHIVWSTHIGTPVPATTLPCGDITPTVGITSTPVIDYARQELFVVADEEGAAGPFHELIGLSLGTGAVLLRQNVDPPGANTVVLLQRTALTLDGGSVVFGYGGNFGLCTYANNGWLVAAPEAGGTPLDYEFDVANALGGVWMGGAAPIVDAQGDIWVGVGNGSVTSGAYDGSDAVVEFSSALKVLQFFAPSNWAAQNANDEDLGSSSPALLASGLVLQAGKSQTLYLMNAQMLGGVGGQLQQITSFCGANVDGGNAISGTLVYMPCQSGVIAVQTGSAPPSAQIQWKTASGAGGPPIIAGGLVWSISISGVLYGLDPNTGSVLQQFSLGSVANHFSTPSVGDGMLFAPGANQVFAFAGP
jgi:outer membrane protein assembly factor BamB